MTIQEKLQKIINVKQDLAKDLVLLCKDKKETQKGVYFDGEVEVEPGVFFDTSEGNIFIGEKTRLRAYCVLRGPIIIGKNSKINSFAEITCSRIGDVSFIGGELYQSVVQSYSNKPHPGFVGHSYVGSWVNLGGGTNTATLKNTYGEVKVDGINTGQIQIGSIIGDYVKTAINTSIFPGKIIGPGANLYGTIIDDVPAFTSHVTPSHLYEIPVDISIKTQKAMVKRRDVEFTKEMENEIRELFDKTQQIRDKAKVRKEKLSFMVFGEK